MSEIINKKYFTDESLSALGENIKNYVADAVDNKAESEHAHDDKYYTKNEMDTKLQHKSNATHNHDAKYDAIGAADTALAFAKDYADEKVANLLNNSTEAVDSIMELAEAMEDNADAIDALTTIAASKADASTLTSHINNKSNPHGVTAAQVGSYTKAEIDSTVSGLNTSIGGKASKATTLSGYGITDAYTKSQVDNITSGKSDTGHSHTTANITDFATEMAKKADVSHGTHVSYGTSATAVGATASAGSASTVSRSDHTHSLSKSAVTTALGYTPPTTDTKYTHPTTSGNKHIPSGGSAGQILRWSADGTAAWGADNNTTYGVVSTTADGLAPKRDGSTTKFLRADGTWAVPPDTDTKYTLPTASSSTLGGVKIGNNINISSGKISVPTADGSTAGVTVVYPAASCTTFSSDSGTVTPLAVQKGAKMFAITRPTSSTNKAITRYSNTTGDVQDSKIIIEDVTNTRDTSKKAQVIAIPAEGNKKMVYGYCTDQVDGTSFIGGVFDANATSYPYNAGLAIGGTSGNLLWKGNKVIDAGCIGDYANKTTVDSSLSSKSTNPVQNKVINSALAGKLSTTGTAAKATADANGNNIANTYAKKSDVSLFIGEEDTGASTEVINADTLGGHTPDYFATADNAMPKSGGTFTGSITMGNGTDILYHNGQDYYSLGEALLYFGENVVPKSGGTFTGTTYARTDARTINYGSGELVNITVRDSSDAAVSTQFIVMIRK